MIDHGEGPWSDEFFACGGLDAVMDLLNTLRLDPDDDVELCVLNLTKVGT